MLVGRDPERFEQPPKIRIAGGMRAEINLPDDGFKWNRAPARDETESRFKIWLNDDYIQLAIFWQTRVVERGFDLTAHFFALPVTVHEGSFWIGHAFA